MAIMKSERFSVKYLAVFLYLLIDGWKSSATAHSIHWPKKNGDEMTVAMTSARAPPGTVASYLLVVAWEEERAVILVEVQAM